MTVLIHGHSPLMPFFPHSVILRFVPRERQLVDQPGTWEGYLNAILAIGRREFVGIWTKPSKFWVGCPGVARVGGVETSYRSTVI